MLDTHDTAGYDKNASRVLHEYFNIECDAIGMQIQPRKLTDKPARFFGPSMITK